MFMQRLRKFTEQYAEDMTHSVMHNPDKLTMKDYAQMLLVVIGTLAAAYVASRIWL